MTKLGLIAIASAAAALAAPAFAQDTSTPPAGSDGRPQVSSPGGGDMALAQSAAQNPPPAAGSGQLWTQTSNSNGTTLTIVANPPIPDTKENRKRYGPPMDHRPLTKPEPPVGSAPAPAPQTNSQ
jgi:hypothetical protein